MHLKHDKWKVYIPRLLHILNEDDPGRRVQFYEWFRHEVHKDEGFVSKIAFSNEATFKMNVTVNRHISAHLTAGNPHIHTEKAVKLPILTVWFGLSYRDLIGLFFFEGTVTGPTYLNMLRDIHFTCHSSSALWE
jgi:hypothetical protein